MTLAACKFCKRIHFFPTCKGCGIEFCAEHASIYHKGNKNFCCKECVLEYDSRNMYDKNE